LLLWSVTLTLLDYSFFLFYIVSLDYLSDLSLKLNDFSSSCRIELFINLSECLIESVWSCKPDSYIVPFDVIFDVLRALPLRKVLCKVNLTI